MAGRRIVVSAHCHTGGLAAGLGAMLPDDDVRSSTVGLDVPALTAELAAADAWVTAFQPDERAPVVAACPHVRTIISPNLFFNAFHPDLVHVIDPSGGWVRTPLDEYHSAIVLWGWKAGLSVDAIVARFTGPVFVGLGYTRRWQASVELLRGRFDQSDVAFDPWLLALRRTGVFMLGDNHPRLPAVLGLARPIARLLGADPDRVDFPWDDTLPDGLLATSPVWPVYPVVADHLGLRGGLIFRTKAGRLLDLRAFVEGSLAGYAHLDPAEVPVPTLFDPLYDAVLTPDPVAG